MNREIKVIIDGNAAVVSRKRRKCSSYLSVYKRVVCDANVKISPIDSCQNYIRVPADILTDMGECRYYTLVNPANGRYADVIVDPNTSAHADMIELTSFLTKELSTKDGNELVICRQEQLSFDKVKIQAFANIKEDAIAVPEEPSLMNMLGDFRLFEIINPLTNDSIYVRSKHIKPDKKLLENEIRLNKKQRNMLSDNIPARLNAEQWNILSDPASKACELFKKHYTPDGPGYTLNTAIDELEYDARSKLQKQVIATFGQRVILRPVIESFRYEKPKHLYRRITDFYVGKSTLSLNCRRPHECDENSDVVRMTESNMLFLGIEPMDCVILRYKEREVKCHVLPFNEDKFSITNIPSIIELSIGIPAHIRNELKLTDIQSSVKVDRDTEFIFKKSFNEHLVPIILTLLSLKFLEDLNWYISAALIAVFIPIVMYITLSTKRNMRGR